MAAVSQINLVVSDLARSRAFYASLGCQLRPITVPGAETPSAWEVTTGFAPIVIHTASFAAWWDASAPPVDAGSTTIDATFEAPSDAADFIEAVRAHGGQVIQPLAPMPWGQSYAICADPDGYRWGVRTMPADAPTPDSSP